MLKFGNDWDKVQKYLTHWSLKQIKSHTAYFKIKLKTQPELASDEIKQVLRRPSRRLGGAKPGVKYRFWSHEEHQRLEDALRRFGKDWTKIADHVKTRSRESVYVNAYYLKKKLAKNPD